MNRIRQLHWLRAFILLVSCHLSVQGMSAVMQRNIYLRGSIRDENGAPVSGVHCSIGWMTGGTFLIPAEFWKEEKSFDGSYEVFRPKGKYMIELFFWKQGYDAKRVQWNNLGAETSTTMVNGQWVLYHDVVMPHEQPMPVLEQLHGVLGTTWKDQLVLAGIDASGNLSKIRITTDTCALDFPYSTGSFLTTTSLVADLVSSPTVREQWSDPAEQPGSGSGRPVSPHGMVAQLRIVNGATSDGLIRYDPPQPERGGFPSEMSTAPADGYTTTVELRPEDFGVGGPPSVYFYVRAKGKFGKCRIYHCRSFLCNWTERRWFSCNLELYMQPDGSRNIATEPPID